MPQEHDERTERDDLPLHTAGITYFMAVPTENLQMFYVERSQVGEDKKADVRKANQMVPWGKATNVYKIFFDTLSIICTTSSEILCRLGRKHCTLFFDTGRLRYFCPFTRKSFAHSHNQINA